jgi:GWxTD domain-containing protein
LWVPLLLVLGGCAGGGGGPDGPEPRTASEFPRPLEIYRRVGLMTGSEDFPGVASLATLAGPADSAQLILGLSLPNSVLRFTREGDAFAARYVVSLRVARDGQPVALFDRTETVRVADFVETGRTDETVLFQGTVRVEPGSYEVVLRVRDGLSARGFEAKDSVRVPEYGTGAVAVAAPVPVYSAQPRTAVAAFPELVLNPRHAVAYGALPARVYMEAYGSSRSELALRDDRGEIVWRRTVELEQGAGVATAVVELPGDSLPLGRFWLSASAAGVTSERVPLLVTISDSWLASNFEEVLAFLRLVAPPEDIEALESAGSEERRERWDEFWAARDPVPATPANEFRDEFFERVRVATQQFGEGGRPGWLTDRGEVYIVLGPPTDFSSLDLGPDRPVTGEPNAQQWTYDRVPGGGRLSLVFVDRGGLGSYRLTPSSEAAFRSVADRIRRQGTR